MGKLDLRGRRVSLFIFCPHDVFLLCLDGFISEFNRAESRSLVCISARHLLWLWHGHSEDKSGLVDTDDDDDEIIDVEACYCSVVGQSAMFAVPDIAMLENSPRVTENDSSAQTMMSVPPDDQRRQEHALAMQAYTMTVLHGVKDELTGGLEDATNGT